MHASELRIGVIGYNIAKVHSYAWLNIPIFYYPILKRPTLIAVSGRNQELTKSFAERFGYKRTYSDWRGLIRDPEVEVVDICTPPNVHSEPAIACCEAGKPMLCEKPLARDAEEA
ncbi:MAG TPA: Gfo/Idh/MocA family oxidoreductase, partial [Methylomirabilota bacterium]|nr:Gfo/Idh/MocA family oxidoreductase [Methylomirabilota bacterium]